MDKPFLQSCENNKRPILDVIRDVWSEPVEVIEIGSGTGQHAVFFAENLPHITWQPTDQMEFLSAINLWVDEANLSNINNPIALNVIDTPWPVEDINALFSANTLHIMNWDTVVVFFQKMGMYLQSGAKACIYGPFNKGGGYTSDSNARFDAWLKHQDPASAIRHLEELEHLAKDNGMGLIEEIEMPANNKILVWQKD